MNAEKGTLIYDTEGHPVKNAYQSAMAFDNFEESSKKELDNFPDNYAVYRNRWFFANFQYQDSAKTVIERELNLLLEVVKEDPGLFHSISDGYLLLGDELKGREFVLKLVEKFPKSPYTFSAINSYEYQEFAQNYRGEGINIVREATQKLLSANITNPEVWHLIVSYYHFFDREIVHKICKNWIEREPDNHQPYNIVGYRFSEDKDLVNEVEYYIAKGIDLMLKGYYRFYDDISGKINDMILSRNYYNLYKNKFAQENLVAAFSVIKAAESLISTSDSKYYESEGDFWKKLGNLKMAEKVYLAAYKKGSVLAEKCLKEVFNRTNNSSITFDEYKKNILVPNMR